MKKRKPFDRCRIGNHRLWTRKGYVLCMKHARLWRRQYLIWDDQNDVIEIVRDIKFKRVNSLEQADEAFRDDAAPMLIESAAIASEELYGVKHGGDSPVIYTEKNKE